MADATYIQFYGLNTVAGLTVTAFVCGLDCGDYGVAADGSILVPFQTDPDRAFTLNLVKTITAPADGWGPLATRVDVYYSGATHSHTIPVAIGFTYPSRGQPLRPNVQDMIKSPEGPGLGKTRRNHMITMLLNQTVGLKVGTSFDNLRAAVLRNARREALNKQTMFNGVYWDTVDDTASFDGMICWEISRPYPCIVASVGSFLHTQDR